MATIPAAVLRIAVPGDTLLDAYPRLQETYCGTLAYQVEHIASHSERVWLREQIESGASRAALPTDRRRRLLERLIQVEALEKFLHKAYLGQKRFSIEGVDMLVPMLDALIEIAGDAQGSREVVLGMAHRGRLNVLAHTVGRPYDTIFAEFEGGRHVEAGLLTPEGGTGDVKYHHGAEGAYLTPAGRAVTVTLVPNPSHLEFVGPVVDGRARAEQTQRRGRDAHHDASAALPVVIHGDAAFAGQGVVAEMLNLGVLNGYATGGTIHIITNNQIGFTTDTVDARSTRYASDLAKGFDIPIIHVNADDPESCLSALQLAMDYRQKFQRDVLIDLLGYRRHGHNESDEPSYTQPLMYQRIKALPTVREKYAGQLVAEGVLTSDEADALASSAYQRLVDIQQAFKASTGKTSAGEVRKQVVAGQAVDTRVAAELLTSLNEQLLSWPADFAVHPKLARQLERRRAAMGPEGGIDWAHAEALALASLLTEGVPVRLTGQDVERGTFSQRQSMLHDVNNGAMWCPLQKLPGSMAPFELHNSPLSELATLGFEYGYSAAAPEALVLWEAQFGDFINGAQVIVDQFLSSGLSKWGLTTRLTLLLPHGYEGQGPEHSSARLERFLQACAEGNMRVANATTPAQYFHLLRRQAKRSRQRPLVIMTPKSLLRHPLATSTLAELAEHQWQPVIDDARPAEEKQQVSRVVLCSGKVYYDIVAKIRPRVTRTGARRAALFVPVDGGARGPGALSEPQGTGMGAGGTAKHGSVDLPGTEASRGAAGGSDADLRWAAGPGQSGRGISGRPCTRAGAHCDAGARLAILLEDRSLGRLPRDVLQRLGQVVAIVEQEDPATALGQEERHERRVSLGCIAFTACEYEVVGTVVGRLAAPRTHMIEGNEFGRGLDAAVRAHRTMLREKPLTMRLHAAPG